MFKKRLLAGICTLGIFMGNVAPSWAIPVTDAGTHSHLQNLYSLNSDKFNLLIELADKRNKLIEQTNEHLEDLIKAVCPEGPGSNNPALALPRGDMEDHVGQSEVISTFSTDINGMVDPLFGEDDLKDAQQGGSFFDRESAGSALKTAADIMELGNKFAGFLENPEGLVDFFKNPQEMTRTIAGVLTIPPGMGGDESSREELGRRHQATEGFAYQSRNEAMTAAVQAREAAAKTSRRILSSLTNARSADCLRESIENVTATNLMLVEEVATLKALMAAKIQADKAWEYLTDPRSSGIFTQPTGASAMGAGRPATTTPGGSFFDKE